MSSLPSHFIYWHFSHKHNPMKVFIPIWTYLINIFRIAGIEQIVSSYNNYCSDIRKLLVEICDSLHITSHHWNILYSTRLLHVTGGWCRHIGPRGPGVSATDDSITAARLIGTRQGVETRRPTVAAAVSAFLLLLLEVSVLGGGTEHVFAIFWLLERNYETDSRRK